MFSFACFLSFYSLQQHEQEAAVGCSTATTTLLESNNVDNNAVCGLCEYEHADC